MVFAHLRVALAGLGGGDGESPGQCGRRVSYAVNVRYAPGLHRTAP